MKIKTKNLNFIRILIAVFMLLIVVLSINLKSLADNSSGWWINCFGECDCESRTDEPCCLTRTCFIYKVAECQGEQSKCCFGGACDEPEEN